MSHLTDKIKEALDAGNGALRPRCDTPRTDALLAEIRTNPGSGGCIPKDFARELERENAHLLLKYRTAFDGLVRTYSKCDWRIAREAAQKCIDIGDTSDGTAVTPS